MFNPSDHLAQFHHNQSSWIARLATGELHPATDHPRLMQSQGTLAVRTGLNGVVMFPIEASDADAVAHDDVLTWLRSSMLQDVLAWSMEPNPLLDLALLAHGYQPGFEPWWMTRDLNAPFQHPMHDVQLATDHDIEALATSDVPYILADQLETTRKVMQTELNSEAFWLVARAGRSVIGQAIVNLTGDHAGLFNVGVSGKHRRQGIGTSLTLAAMRIARDAGAHVINLNSTPAGEHVYQRLGFRRIGTGQTWSLPRTRSRWSPAPEMQRAVIALGTGDLDLLHGLQLPSRFGNTLSPQQLAARFRQHAAVRYLLDQGDIPDILALWQAGMKEEALEAVTDPAARDHRYGPRQATPLHLAIEAGAGTLVIALIKAGADVNARDVEYRATPLDWAHACDKPTIARIIRQAGGK